MIHIEVRKKIVEARQKNLTLEEIAKAYNFDKSSISRLLQQHRETGDISPKTHLRGRKPALDESGMGALRELILARPDITLEEVKETMRLTISLAAICKIINQKLGFRYKKKRYTQANKIDRT